MDQNASVEMGHFITAGNEPIRKLKFAIFFLILALFSASFLINTLKEFGSS